MQYNRDKENEKRIKINKKKTIKAVKLYFISSVKAC